MNLRRIIKGGLICLSMCFATIANAQINICLFDDTSFAAAQGVRGVTSADFNKDGNADIAVTAYYKVLVYMGNGNGGFAAPVIHSLSASDLTEIISADFNSDGNIDLAFCEPGSPSKLNVMLGSSTGVFATPTTYTAGSIALSLASGDFNNDNKIDIVMANYYGDNISVFKGDGNGGFSAATNYTIGTNPKAIDIAAADLNGDGIDDIVTVSYTQSYAAVFLSTGTSFATPVTYALPTQNGSDPISIILNDLNNDSKADICVAMSNSDSVAVSLGVGDGTFSAVVMYNIGSASAIRDVIAADINVDGIPEIITANLDAGTISILLGLGNGTFSSPLTLAAGPQCVGLASTDLNNDGYIDIAITNDTNTATTFSVIMNALPSLKTTVTNATITADQPGATYQWINCSTKAVIPGATQKSFSPTVTGSYAVIIDRAGCGDTSACKMVTVPVGIKSIDAAPIKIFPNPANDVLHVEMNNNSNATYFLQDINGKTIKRDVLQPGKLSIDISTLQPGLYIMLLSGENIQQQVKITKQ